MSSDTSSRGTNTIDVPSIGGFSKKIEDIGGKIVNKMIIPGIGYLAICEDTEGIRSGII